MNKKMQKKVNVKDKDVSSQAGRTVKGGAVDAFLKWDVARPGASINFLK